MEERILKVSYALSKRGGLIKISGDVLEVDSDAKAERTEN